MRMCLRVIAWGVWRIWTLCQWLELKPFPTNRSLRTPDLGLMTHLNSMSFDCSSGDSIRTGPGHIHHDLNCWEKWAPFWSLLGPPASSSSLSIAFSLILKTPSLPSLREVITLISNSDGACFPVILLLTCWGWGCCSPGCGWTETWVELLGNFESLPEDDCDVAPPAELLPLEEDLKNEQHLNPSPESQTWLGSFVEEGTCHSFIWSFVTVQTWLVSCNLKLFELQDALLWPTWWLCGSWETDHLRDRRCAFQ